MSTEILVEKSQKLGIWQGLGGAITEATAYNFSKLSPSKQRELLEVYYGKNGLDYRWGRISIGSNDFCLKPYEYTKRIDLSDFSIKHDERYVLPMIKKILSKKKLKLVASPWSPPKCMKLTPRKRPGGVLKPWCYKDLAKYIHKWLEAYMRAGIKISYLTPQNEPHASQIWESCFYPYFLQRKLAYKDLARELEDLDTKILLWDHNKEKLVKTADKLFRGTHVTKYGRTEKVAGLCYHWYDGTFADQMWQVRKKYPSILMISTEMSCGFSPYNEEDWQRDASLYYRELFADINAGASAFIDWNMILDWRGGPSYCQNYVKSPIILNEKGDVFILTPIYRALEKFVKLFPAESEVVRCEYSSDDVVAIARETKAGYKVVVANVSEKEQKVTVKCGKQKTNLRLAGFELYGVNIL